jgi:hypothetical protein
MFALDPAFIIAFDTGFFGQSSEAVGRTAGGGQLP